MRVSSELAQVVIPCAAALTLLMASALESAALPPASDAELVRDSTLVVDARVVRLEPYWKGDLIFTSVELEVSETLLSRAGPADDTIWVHVPGGEIGTAGVKISHSAVFRVGERAVVFIRPWTGGRNVVTGGQDGKLSVDSLGRIRERNMSVDQFRSRVRSLDR